MNKNILAIVSFLLITLLVFAACKDDRLPPPGEPVKTTVTEKVTDKKEENKTEKHEQKVPSTSKRSEETTKKQEETTKRREETTAAPAGEVEIGFTSKGNRITQKNGITYIDGVMIANKTYRLPRDYNPGALTPECAAAFEEMKKAAAKEGLSLYNGSGFRSYDLQERIYNRYVGRDGKAEADRYSARPGHSEHQTGMAIDLNDISSAFANTKEGKWVDAHAWEYGFILRYKKDTEDKTGYMYEPWHIRYIGKEMAEKVYSSGLCLEEYFGITSEYDAPIVSVG